MCGCTNFNQNYFLKEAFQLDLMEISKGYPTKKKNGLLIIERVEFESIIYILAFPRNPQKSEGYFPVYHLEKEIGDLFWGEAYFLNWKNFDGNAQMTIYYPKKKKLIFGYFSGSGG
jgi:hypothetical protein